MFKKGFTLIELLVVIAIIALLMAIVMPGLRKAKEYARKVICGSNLRQVGIAVGTYESQTGFDFRQKEGEKGWFYGNGTADMPWEWQPYFTRDIMAFDVLPNREVFFCAGVRNIAHNRNYLYAAVQGGNLQTHDTETVEIKMANDPSFTDRPVFWSTYVWLWKKGHNPSLYNSNNNASNGVLLSDVPNQVYQYAMGIGNTDAQVLTAIFGGVGETVQTVPHGNVLMKDLSLQNPADKVEEFNQWLWGDDKWAGM